MILIRNILYKTIFETKLIPDNFYKEPISIIKKKRYFYILICFVNIEVNICIRNGRIFFIKLINFIQPWVNENEAFYLFFIISNNK